MIVIGPRLAFVAALTLCAASCASEPCVTPPCPLRIAITLSITAASTATGIAGASVEVSGPSSTTFRCDSSCTVAGTAGTYTVVVTAPGYQNAERVVTVPGENHPCGCGTVVTQQVSFVLTPSS